VRPGAGLLQRNRPGRRGEVKAVPTLDLSEFDPPALAQKAPSQRVAIDVAFPEFEPPPPKPVVPRELAPLEDEWYVHDQGEVVITKRRDLLRKPARKPGEPRYIVSPLQEHSGVPGTGPLSLSEAGELARRLEMVRETMEK
jgi:hypothetical protein